MVWLLPERIRLSAPGAACLVGAAVGDVLTAVLLGSIRFLFWPGAGRELVCPDAADGVFWPMAPPIPVVLPALRLLLALAGVAGVPAGRATAVADLLPWILLPPAPTWPGPAVRDRLCEAVVEEEVAGLLPIELAIRSVLGWLVVFLVADGRTPEGFDTVRLLVELPAVPPLVVVMLLLVLLTGCLGEGAADAVVLLMERPMLLLLLTLMVLFLLEAGPLAVVETDLPVLLIALPELVVLLPVALFAIMVGFREFEYEELLLLEEPIEVPILLLLLGLILVVVLLLVLAEGLLEAVDVDGVLLVIDLLDDTGEL
jgi:hypothetical protein